MSYDELNPPLMNDEEIERLGQPSHEQDMGEGGKEVLSTNKILNKEIALIIIEGQSRFAKFDDLNNFELSTKQAVDDWYASLFAVDEDGEPITYKTSGSQMPAFKVWTTWDKKNKYSGLIFDPSKPKAYKDKLNLWKGLSIEPKEGDCQLILNHIKHIWCKNHKPTYEYVLNWFARMLQKPHLQGETAITLASGQGTGKNIILDIFSRILKNHQTVSTKLSDIVGKYNDHLATSVFVFLNEAIWGGDKTAEGTIKALITDNIITMEKKFMPMVTVKNCTHLVIASNNEWYASLGLDDRRYITLTPSEEKKGNTQYFNKLSNQIKNGGGEEAFLYYLINRDISKFEPRVTPEASEEIKEERGRTKLLNANSVIKWAVDFIINEGMEVQGFKNIEWHFTFPEIPKNDLLQSYNEYCKTKFFHSETDKAFYQKINKLFNLKSTRPTISNKQIRCYTFEKFEDCKLSVIKVFNGDNPFKQDEVLEEIKK